MKLDGSLVSELDDNVVGVKGNFDEVVELLESELDLAGAGEPRIGLDLSSDFSDGVFLFTGGDVR